MEPAELRQLVADDDIDTVIVAFTDHYGRLMGKRFDADFFLADAIDHGTHGCDYLLTVDMEMEPVPGYRFANWELGYGDVHLVPDLTTLARAGWTDRTALVLCDLVDDGPDGSAAPVAPGPRSILRSQVDRLADRGLTAMAASELEFFLYEDSYREADQRGHAGLRPAGHYIEDYHLLQGGRVEPYVGAARRALRRTGIPVENSKGEWGRGQHELNVRYADVSTMADRHTVMKHAMKELADQQGVSVTFMAKPHTDEAGSSCHLHLSLWAGGANAFAGPGGEPTDLFRWFLGGWMANVEAFMPFYAPTVNAYKRYADGSWAPTRVAWSRDNRTAGFRVVGAGSALRIECRIPGADVNPYLAYAAALASGLHGIEHRTEPPPEFRGDAYQADDLPRVPHSLERAVEGLRTSEVARAALGADVVEHYAHFFDVEVAAFHQSVTDWERRRYFERI